MAGIDLKDFRGFNKTRDERLLAPNEARSCSSVLFDGSGALRTYDNPWFNVHSFGVISPAPTTIFRYDTGVSVQWLRWNSDVELARGPAYDDTLRRIYLTGDGAPKMSHKNIAPTFRPLGVPAPATKPATSTTIPTEALSGTITALTCSTLSMIHEVKGKEGRNSGSGETNVVSTSTVSLTTMPVGTRLKVASIVDANNVTVTGIGTTNYACTVDKLNYGLRWTSASGAALWRKGKKAYWNFLVPSGATLTITGHQLQPGDILQITATQSIMSWPFTTLATSPNTDQNSRTATAAGSIVFAGNCNFIIDRGGETIDPLVPSQNYVIEQRAYVVTHVTNIGEESAPSPASDIISVAVGEPVTINSFPAVPSGYDITHRRIYRTNTGDDGTEFQFVTEQAVASTSYSDTLDPSELGEVIPSEAWLVPPTDLRGIVALPNGAMAGFSGKNLCFSEPGYPHAWPAEYRYPVDFDVVGIQVFGSSVFVGTTGNPYIFVGSHPRQMGGRRIPMAEPCLGRTSPTSIGDGVAYVSPNGVIVVSESRVENITKDKIPQEIWRELMDPRTNAGFNIRGYWHMNRLEYTYAWTGSVGAPFLSVAFSGDRTDFSDGGRAEFVGFLEPSDGSLHRIRTVVDGATYVQELLTEVKEDTVTTGGASSYWTGLGSATWESAKITLARPANMAWCRVTFDYSGAETPPSEAWSDNFLVLYFRSYLQNREVNTYTKQLVLYAEPEGNDLLFRMPEGFIAESVVVDIQFSGYLRIKRVQIGETVEDVL